MSNRSSNCFSVIINWGHKTIAGPKGLQINPLSIDKLATLSNLISASARKGISFFDIVPETWYLSGGGRLNNSIVQGFKKEFGKKIVLVDDLGLNGDSMEAQAFAYLAVRSMRGLPFTWNNTTGVKNPTSGGLLNFALKLEG